MPDSDTPDFAMRDPDMPDDALGLGLDLPAVAKPAAPPAAPGGAAYRVLARKYRPQTFAELIGQDAMVQTLGNAIKRDRLAHATQHKSAIIRRAIETVQQRRFWNMCHEEHGSDYAYIDLIVALTISIQS